MTMKHLPLTLLRAFAAVYDTGGIRSAGRALGVSHSAISRHVHDLEAWLGVPLLRRAPERRNPRFTLEGESLGKSVLAALTDLEAAVASVRQARHVNAVVVDTTPSFAVRWLLPRLAAFQAAHRRLELSVLVDQRSRPLAETGADIGLRMGAGPWPDLDCTPLMNDCLYPVMSPAYWRDQGRPADLAALARLRLLHDRDPGATWSIWRKHHGPADLDVRAGPRFASSDLVLRAAEQGLGVALARDRLVRDSVAAGTLVAPFADLAVDCPNAYWIVMPPDTRSRWATRTVLAWLKAEAASDRA